MTSTQLAPRPVADDPRDAELLAAPRARRTHPGRWFCAAVALLFLAMAVHSAVSNPRFEWNVVALYFNAPTIVHGLGLTLWLTAAVMVTGYVLGIGIAVARLSDNVVLRTLSFGFVWIVRSVPPLVQLLFWFELASLYPRVSIGVPFGPEFAGTNTAHLFSGVLAAFVALTLDIAAFSSEIVRGGILSVDRLQTESAQSLGLSKGRILRRIVLPQAMPSIVPASGNLLIGLLKATSIVSVIAVQDLLYSVQVIYNQNFRIIPLLLVATIWYVVVTTILSIGQFFVERHYNRGTAVPGGRGLLTVARANLPLLGDRSRFLAGIS